MNPERVNFFSADYEFVQYVRHVKSDEHVALLRDYETGKLFYLSKSEYAQAATPPSNGNEHHQDAHLPSPLVTRQSPTSEKIALFRSLFKGREDAYALRYVSRKTGKPGYSPVCSNKGNRTVCQLGRGVKCRDCEYRAFISLDDETLRRHFRGQSERCDDVVGIYVLRNDATTSVLVADFDENDWINAASAYRDAARSFCLFPAVERSRSGEGAHVWIFFDEPIDAQMARDLGFAIITTAMRTTGTMDFSSYDRLFPTQSTVQPGGLGNLIALPLQGRAGAQGNSLFVDDDFRAFPDQFAYLSVARKTTLAEVKNALERASSKEVLGFAPANETTQDIDKPPCIHAKRNQHTLDSSTTLSREHIMENCMHNAAQTVPLHTEALLTANKSILKTIRIKKSNGLHIDAVGLPTELKDHIRRLAVFANPDFFRNQNMHRSVFGSPHFIWLYEETGDEIILPRGCEANLLELLHTRGIKPIITDSRPNTRPIAVKLIAQLREAQQKALDALICHEYGILSAPTGFGKTVVGAALIAHRQARTLVIVPRSALVDQWRNSLEKFLTLDEELPVLLTKTGRRSKNQLSAVGHVGSSKHPANGLIDIATFQALTEPSDIPGTQRIKELVNNYDMIICDECHYCAAEKLQLILRSVQARYVYGLSATPKRTDRLERMIYMQCGPIRFVVDPKTQSASQHFQRLLRPRFTRIRIPDLEPNSNFNTVLDKLCKHSVRNDLVVEDTIRTLADGRTPLVITRRVEHAEFLAERLSSLGHFVFLLTGAGTNKEKRRALDALRAHPKGIPFAIVATGSYIGEGFDEPRLDTLILATPAASETIVTQYSGRLHRESDGKSEVIVYDYVDASIPMLDQMYRKRLRTYRKLGYEVSPEQDNTAESGTFVGPSDCVKALCHDISAAGKSVLLNAIYANPKYLQLVLPMLAEAHTRGISVQVGIKEPKNRDSLRRAANAIKALEDAGCHAQILPTGRFGLAIFDEKTIWYGSLPLLAFGKQDDCSLRFESAEVAGDLLNETKST